MRFDDMKISFVDPFSLRYYSNNAKVHTADQVEQIANSIREFGFVNPVIAWHDENGRSEIVAGHGRVMAAKTLGLKSVPVVFADEMTDEERRAFTHIDNQLNLLTGFDFATLDEELANLNFDFEMFGFDVPEFDEEESEDETYKVTLEFSIREKARIKDFISLEGKEGLIDIILRNI